MNADAIRHFYEYHFAENRKIWNQCVMALSDEVFLEPVAYSIGSIRNHVVHMMSVDGAWFSGLRGDDHKHLNPEEFVEREVIRAYWDGVEEGMRAYLATLTDEMLMTRPFPGGEDEKMILWQVLLHVVNHGTDHRAQVLRLIHDAGVKTESQGYVFFIFEEDNQV